MESFMLCVCDRVLQKREVESKKYTKGIFNSNATIDSQRFQH